MNKSRKRSLAELVNEMSTLMTTLEGIMSEESDAMDNIPENLQESERYQSMEEGIECLENALSSMEEAADSIREVL